MKVLQPRLEAKHYLRAALELVQDMKYFLAVAENKTDEDSYTSMGLWDWKQQHMLCCADSNGMNQEYSRNQFNAVEHILRLNGPFELPPVFALNIICLTSTTLIILDCH